MNSLVVDGLAEPVALTACDREPLHVPGQIQPHGVLVALSADGRQVSHVSANFEISTGLPASAAFDSDVENLFGEAGFAAIAQSLDRDVYAPANILTLTLPIPLRPRRKLTTHRHLGRTIIEIEESGSAEELPLSMARTQDIIAGLRCIDTFDGLCGYLVDQLRALTAFDRVMVYRFDEQGNGEVIAEAKHDGLAPYLNLHYPAGDIPRQARRMYLRQRVRSIPDARAVPVRMVTAPRSFGGDPLDMTYCALRAVSPVHLEYMANMGVSASLSIALVHKDALWGMIICHHQAPRAASPELRALCDVIGQMVSVVLTRMHQGEAIADRLARFRSVTRLRDGMDAAPDVVDGLCRHSATLLDMMGATGAVLRIGGRTETVGRTPPVEDALGILRRLEARPDDEPSFLSNAGTPGGVAESFADTAAGVFLLRLTRNDDDLIAWFRPELVATVRWGGDPTAKAAGESDTGRLSPRKSFAPWTQELRGRSPPWTSADRAAAGELRRAIVNILLHRSESRLAYLSLHDPLTGLANRRSLQERAQRDRLGESGLLAAFLFIDLDRFKSINDTLGHAAGDKLLVEVAVRLRDLAPSGSFVSRFGGDEFVVYLPARLASGAEAFAVSLAAELARPYNLYDKPFFCGASIGVSISSSLSLDERLRDADIAMYEAKRQGGSRALLYQPETHGHIVANMGVEQELFRAIESHELEIHYQPIVSTAGRSIYGLEALMRWRHPSRGWISPADFIPRAEEGGLIARLGLWLMPQAMAQIAIWRRAIPDLRLSLNVSVRQLTDPAFRLALEKILTEGEVPAASICLEVTESTLMNEAALRELTSLRGAGVKIAIDDFGTGYSSLSYLERLPVDIVKIDRSFVTPLGTSAKADRFFAAVIDLARTLDLTTIAEGCETEQQWQAIAATGCSAVQGWVVAKAMDAADAQIFLDRHRVAWRLAAHGGGDAAHRARQGETGVDAAAQPRPAFANAARPHDLSVFLAMVRLSATAMCLVDPHGPDMPVVFVNEAFEQLTGYGEAECLGRNCRFLQGAETDPAARRAIRDALSRERRVTVELINYRRDGTPFWNALSLAPVFGANGALAYYVGNQVNMIRRGWG